MEEQLKRGEITNINTLSHVIQVLQLHRTAFTQSQSCAALMTSLTTNQNASGSFGNVMTSAGLLGPLSGVSLLHLRHFKCPLRRDKVEERDVRKFIASQRRREEQHGVVSSTEESVVVKVTVESNVDEVEVSAHAQYVT